MHAVRTLVDGLDHPEGVAYDRTTGALYAGGEAGQVYRVELDHAAFAQVAQAPGFVLGLAVDALGRVVLCCTGAGVFAWADGALRPIAREIERPNFPAFAPDG